MSKPPPSLLQGRDWSTSRESVAAALGTLDLVSDYCVCHGPCEARESSGNALSLMSNLKRLNGILSGQIDVACADVLGADKMIGDFSQSWAFFEMRMALKELASKMADFAALESTKTLAGLIAPIKQIKLILKRLDQ